MSATRSGCCGSSTETASACRGAGGDRFAATAARGFTLIELMWAMTLSLIVMAAVASLFGVFTRSLTEAQNAADMSARLRTAAWRLRQDLSGVTVDLMPPVRPESESGYFEYFEGPCRDGHAQHGYGGCGLVADVDDVLMFTTRSEGQPFVGRYGDGTIESPVAEVAWFCRPSSVQPLTDVTLFTLYRRQELVIPYVGRAPFLGTNSTASFDMNLNDLSVRLEGGNYIPNSLGDLTKRENRFLRSGTTTFPHDWAVTSTFVTGTLLPNPGEGSFKTSRVIPLAGPAATLSGSRVGQDVILSNILSFDVRVFDPMARPGTGPSLRVFAEVGNPTLQHPPPEFGNPPFYFDMDSVLKTGAECWSPLTGTGTMVAKNFIPWQSGPKSFTLSKSATATGTTWLTFPGVVLQPGDPYWGGPGFFATLGPPGGYVDLAWGGEVKVPWMEFIENNNVNRAPGFFPPAAAAAGAAFPPAGQTAYQSGGLRVKSGTVTTSLENGFSRTYDTWSTHYESNGRDDDDDTYVDEGTNGLDDNGDGVPDDPAEAETSAPYPSRLRGLEIRIRCYEPASGQIRQTTLRHTFLAR